MQPRSGRMIVLPLVIMVAVLAAAVIGVVLWYQGSNYVTEADAQVTAPMAPVGSAINGTLTSWSVSQGQAVSQGQVLGVVTGAPIAAAAPAAGAKHAAAQPASETFRIVSPMNGTVIQTTGIAGQVVEAGLPLAYVANLNTPSITAYVKESEVRHVAPGEPVDITVDAAPGTTFSGSVRSVGLATAATFSLLPSAPQSGSFTRVTQRIPVVISLTGAQGLVLPGESATVRIHINK